jgi:hypothetical protein
MIRKRSSRLRGHRRCFPSLPNSRPTSFAAVGALKPWGQDLTENGRQTEWDDISKIRKGFSDFTG